MRMKKRRQGETMSNRVKELGNSGVREKGREGERGRVTGKEMEKEKGGGERGQGGLNTTRRDSRI